MKKIIIAVHGGASDYAPFIRRQRKETEEGLAQAVTAAFKLLEGGKTALDAVELAVQILENNPLFNAGRGSVLTSKKTVEMDAAIMEGKHLDAGAVCMLSGVKNPIGLARLVMEKTKHVLLCGQGALDFAKKERVVFEKEAYFITDNQIAELEKATIKHGTVGAVALDKNGNLAAATSTGGTNNCFPGRVGDSCIIGAGCYANNKTCAVSGTGIGEYLIRGVVANTISLMVERQMSLQEACEQVIFDRNPDKGEMGVISVNTKAELGIAFNTEIMKRAWKTTDGELQVYL